MYYKKFKVGDLVWIKSVFENIYDPPALIIGSYISHPKIFTHNDKENNEWLLYDDIKKDWVYDIVHLGSIELAVSGEWLVPWSPKTTQEQ